MSKINSPAARKIWSWRRWIRANQQDTWIARLQATGCMTWTFTERPDRRQILLAVYQEGKAGALSLQKQFGGQVSAVENSTWMPSKSTPPTRIGSKLEIIHETVAGTKEKTVPRLHIPHGLAFGSGDHGTTYMLLRALTDHAGWDKMSVLDLGTGSGVLALAARLFGATKIVATDFDAEAVRTARQNEALNFSAPLICWQCADVKKLRTGVRYDLVLANLFSGILCEVAPRRWRGALSRVVCFGLVGCLKSQEKDVSRAFRGQKLKLLQAVGRGKWVMLQWRKPDPAAK